MKLRDCPVGAVINLTPELTPIIGEAYKTGGAVDLARKTYYVYPVAWRDNCWCYTNGSRLRIDGDREVTLRDQPQPVES